MRQGANNDNGASSAWRPGAPRRTAAVFAGFALFASVSFAATSSAQDADRPGPEADAAVEPTNVSAAILDASQQGILSSGRVRARVASAVAGRMHVKAKVRSASASASTRITKPKRLRFGAPISRRVKLRLTPAGQAALATCEAKELIVRVKLAGAGAEGRGVATEQLALDSGTCTGAATTPPGGGGGGGGGGPQGNVIPPPTDYTGPPIATGPEAGGEPRCDWLDDHGSGDPVCLQPFPNNHFTRPDDQLLDPDTDTNLLLNLNRDSMPANTAGIHIDPYEQNLNDGFSPGSSIITKVPGLNSLAAMEQTGAVGIDNPDAFDDPNQPIVVINADTGERHPVWSEIDFNPIDPVVCGNPPKEPCEPESVNLIIRPLVNFEEGERYIVALRNLKNAQGQTIQPSDAFRVYRDNLVNTGQTAVEARRAHFEDLFEELGDADQVIDRADLYLAWDFTVASERNLTERALFVRDNAFTHPTSFGFTPDDDLSDLTVQGNAPQFSITSTTNFTPAQNARIARRVEGQITNIPCFLDTPGCPPGSRFTFAPGQTVPTWVPLANTTTTPFTCDIPRSAIDPPGPNPARPSLYGHGLLGLGTEVTGGNIQAMASEHNFMHCATDWAGFSTLDIGTVLLNLQDLSHFRALTDRMQQGFVNMMYLGRAMIHPSGFSANADFRDGGQSVIDTDRLFYDGNSQGGIMGGALTALAPDFERAVLGVPGMNYSTLLTRSVDFEPYAEGQFGETVEGEICDNIPNPPSQMPDEIEGPLNQLRTELQDLCAGGIPDDTDLGLYDNYPNKLERPLIFAVMQLLWDRGEGNGYAHHMTDDELPNTPEHDVLLHAAFGDHQVANVTAEVEARTIGAPVYQPALDPGRHWEDDGAAEIFGIPSLTSFPSGGSALVYWDGGPVTPSNPGGTATPPDENIPPRPPIYGSDPHSYPRNDVKGRAQKAAFLAVGGVLQNPCRTVNNTLTTPPSGPSGVVFSGGTVTPCYAHGWTGP